MMIRPSNLSEVDKVINLKMKMSEEVGSLPYLIENAEAEIHREYTDLYNKEWARHFVIEEDGVVVACAGGIIKNDIPYCFLKTPFYGFVVDVIQNLNIE